MWIAEVAVNTFGHDSGYKAELYASAGVPEYWVLDVERRRIFIFTSPQPAISSSTGYAYADRVECDAAARVRPATARGETVDVASLFQV